MTLLIVAGCSGKKIDVDYSRLPLADVSGVVTLDGEPLVGATVRFCRAEQPAVYESGTTDDRGRYVAVYDSYKNGVTPGEKFVQILAGRGESAGGAAASIPERYNRRSELRRTVERNGDHTFDFELTSD